MKWTLTNLLSVSSMTISGASLADGDFTFPAGVFCMINQDLPTPTVGHLYYGRVDQKVPAGTTFADGRFEYFAGDADRTLNIVFTSFSEATQDNDWHSYSGIRSFVSLGASSGYGLRSFTVNGSNTVYRRNHIIIDLTEAFGAGKEPTKEWCDRCIPFFEGSTTIETSPLVGVGGIARKLKAGYVGVNGIARKIIAGYVGVNGAAKIIWKSSGIEDGTLIIYANVVEYDAQATEDTYCIIHSGSEGITVDWGDGTTTTSQLLSHRYSFSGSVIIKVKYNDDSIFESYSKQSEAFFYRSYYDQQASKSVSDNTAMTKIIAPDMKIFGGYAFYGATGLTSIETRLPIEINELHEEIFTTSLQDEPREVHIASGAIQYKDTPTLIVKTYFGDNSFVPVFEGIITVSGLTTVDCYKLYSPSKKLTDIVIKFNFGNEISVPSQMSGLFTQSTQSKYTQTYIVYTDNQTIHDFAIAKNNEYTTYTVKHLDGSDW